MRKFNTTGPVFPDRHYCLPPLSRVNLREVLTLVEDGKFFVLHAPRQTGKTSALLALRDLLNRGEHGEYRCVYISLEMLRTAGEDSGRMARGLLGAFDLAERSDLGSDFVGRHRRELLESFDPEDVLHALLRLWAAADSRALVLLLDEVDTLSGKPLFDVLAQLRSGYALARPREFPQSVVLCGLRDIHDYRAGSMSGGQPASRPSGSPFNIKAKSLRLGDFTGDEVAALLAQHTEETGQAFAPEAVEAVFEQTQGQPWLVNALAREICFEEGGPGLDRDHMVIAADVMVARETLIVRREAHIDQLADRLRDPRIRRVVEPMLAGSEGGKLEDDDIRYAEDLGLVVRRPLRIANPIYREVVPRVLTGTAEELIPHRTAWYVDERGELSMGRLMRAFQEYFREHAEHWPHRFDYEEPWAQLLLQTFLHRIVNARGGVDREYGLGSGRVDLFIRWPVSGRGVTRHVVECKVVRRGRWDRAVVAGVGQVREYLERTSAATGHVVVFDQRKGRSWKERLVERVDEKPGVPPVHVWGM